MNDLQDLLFATKNLLPTFDVEPGGVLDVSRQVGNLGPAGELRLVKVPGGGEEYGAHHSVSLRLGLETI